MLKCLLRVIEEHEQQTPPSVEVYSFNNSEKNVLELLRKNGRLTIPDVSEHTGLSVSGVKKIIQSLKKAGILSREGASKSGKWVINEEKCPIKCPIK